MKISRHMGPSSMKIGVGGHSISGTGNKSAPGIGKRTAQKATKERKSGKGSHGVATGKYGIQSR